MSRRVNNQALAADLEPVVTMHDVIAFSIAGAPIQRCDPKVERRGVVLDTLPAKCADREPRSRPAHQQAGKSAMAANRPIGRSFGGSGVTCLVPGTARLRRIRITIWRTLTDSTETCTLRVPGTQPSTRIG